MTGAIKILPAAPLDALKVLTSEHELAPGRPALAQTLAAEKTNGAPTRIAISATGQLLGSLLMAADKSAPESGSPMLHASRPLVPAAEMKPATLAAAMREAIEFSGLFYESHLAEWNDNIRSREDVMREPQAGVKSDVPLDKTPLPQLVQSQLDMLETRQLHWQGQAWPGAPLQLDIEEQANNGAEEISAWHSNAVFTLPALGTVRARMVMQSERLQLVLLAEDEKTADLLRAKGTALVSALEASGTLLEKFSTHSDDKT